MAHLISVSAPAAPDDGVVVLVRNTDEAIRVVRLQSPGDLRAELIATPTHLDDGTANPARAPLETQAFTLAEAQLGADA